MTLRDKTLLTTPIAVSLVLLLPALALAYSVSWAPNSTNVVRWPSSSVGYNLHSGGAPGINDGSDIQAVVKAFTMWQAVTCSSLTFTDTGQPVNPNDLMVAVYQQNGNYYSKQPNGKNEIAWLTDWFYGPYVLGITSPVFGVPDGLISEADIGFNGQISWTANPSGNHNQKNDVLSIALHEIGHYFGVQHVLGGYDPATPPVMAPSASSTQWQTTQILKDDDQRAACFLYPKGSYSCASDSQCPYVVTDDGNDEKYLARYQCKSGSCGEVTYVIPSANKGLGETCVSGQYDCSPDLFCQQMQATNICTRNCNPSSDDCPNGFYCAEFYNSSGGACIPGQAPQPPKPKQEGESCDYSNECATGLCIGTTQSNSVCRKSCNPAAPNCAQGMYCATLQSGSGGACIPGQNPTGGTSKKKNGEECQGGEECESGVCAGDQNSTKFFCRQSCDPNNPSCGANEGCVGFLDGQGGACIAQTSQPTDVKHGTGAPCQSPDDCQSDLCVRLAESQNAFCSQLCNSATDCPCGMQCVGSNSGNLCVTGERVACVDLGSSCTKSSECKSGVCANGLCKNDCDITDLYSCGSGIDRCKRTEKGSNSGSCEPVGAKEVGDFCLGDNECKTLFCEDPGTGTPICLVPCLADKQNCQLGQSCTPVYNNLGGCFLDNGQPAPLPDAPILNPDSGADTTGGQTPSGDGGGSGCQLHSGNSSPTQLPWLALVTLLAGLLWLRRRRLDCARPE